MRTLDPGLLQAGAGVKGEFENRLKSVIDEVKASPTPIVLFIDEAHTLIGAGGHGRAGRRGQSAQARPRARRTAHHRRHHLGRVQEVLRKGPGPRPPLPARQGRESRPSRRPSRMLRGWSPMLEKHHGVRILDEAVSAAVRLSQRYIPAASCPTRPSACSTPPARAWPIGQNATPAAVEDATPPTTNSSTSKSSVADA